MDIQCSVKTAPVDVATGLVVLSDGSIGVETERLTLGGREVHVPLGPVLQLLGQAEQQH